MDSMIVEALVSEGARIEREKQGRALTADEAKTLQAVGFLRIIAPYLFEAPPAADAVDPDEGSSTDGPRATKSGTPPQP